MAESRILILGFHTRQALQQQVYESTLAAICWGMLPIHTLSTELPLEVLEGGVLPHAGYIIQQRFVSYIHIHEAIRVGISWGITSLFIRKGLNPDVRDGRRFIHKYWRDTMCGMLAMSCLVFVKLAREFG